jgi:DNA repair protein RecN (Recombination protein N)
MLRELRIRNFAVISDLELHFQEGFTVLTGETGAGKSILVDAVELLLGGRAGTDYIRTGSDEAVLEAAFTQIPPHTVTERLQEMGLLVANPSEEEEILIRRIISRTGKSRIYLNGGLIPLGLLQPLGELLVDIHGQHEHQSLLKPALQLELLDDYGKLGPLRETYRQHYVRLRALRREKEQLESSERDRAKQEDLLRFQQHEIQSANLSVGEEEQLVQERQILSNAERLATLSAEAYEVLYGSEGSVLSQLARVEKVVAELSLVDPRWSEGGELSSQAANSLREVAERLRTYQDRIEHDPKRLEEIEDRLHLIGRLKKKFGATIEEILTALKQFEEELAGLSNREERLREIEEKLKEEQSRVRELAQKLSGERILAARSLAQAVEKELKNLRMGSTTFEVGIQRMEDEETFEPTGADHIEFVIAPNPGEDPRPLSRIASGGELSRIMLALKGILAGVDRVPTLIFDEVDAGIGGAVAEVVGRRLSAIARHRQVFCITHLPQIAALASTHIAVEKKTEGGRTTTRAASLSDSDRVEEIARMLGGRKITSTTLQHAREMLGLVS